MNVSYARVEAAPLVDLPGSTPPPDPPQCTRSKNTQLQRGGGAEGRCKSARGMRTAKAHRWRSQRGRGGYMGVPRGPTPLVRHVQSPSLRTPPPPPLPPRVCRRSYPTPSPSLARAVSGKPAGGGGASSIGAQRRGRTPEHAAHNRWVPLGRGGARDSKGEALGTRWAPPPLPPSPPFVVSTNPFPRGLPPGLTTQHIPPAKHILHLRIALREANVGARRTDPWKSRGSRGAACSDPQPQQPPPPPPPGGIWPPQPCSGLRFQQAAPVPRAGVTTKDQRPIIRDHVTGAFHGDKQCVAPPPPLAASENPVPCSLCVGSTSGLHAPTRRLPHTV